MRDVTPGNPPLLLLDELMDNERRARFFTGGEQADGTIAPRLLAALEPLPRPGVSIHVAGSEGKTSTTVRLAAGLSALGLKTGAFTSPHLHDPLERLCIGGALPPAPAVAQAASLVMAAARSAGLAPSWFDALTAVARVLFAGEGVQGVVWETGLGGRLDSTRAVHADLCLITSISLEHTALLGDTLAEIATEKAGILRPGVPLLLPAGLPPQALEVFAERAQQLHCPLELVPSAPGAVPQGISTDLALAALARLGRDGLIPAGDEGLRQTVTEWRVPGREQSHDGVLFDGAHSLAAVQSLAARRSGEVPGPVVFAATSGRDGLAMAVALLPVADPLIVTAVPGPRRGADPAELLKELCSRAPFAASAPVAEPDPQRALALARKLSQSNRQIVVTGSLYLVGLLLPPGSSSC
ncbi:MAG: dihydrofolate synthase/folylpolyglutamate synthase [Pseudohongiellaceae bacterium]|jgi:dihydrofolate synthase/folylpolyglutamate synthase